VFVLWWLSVSVVFCVVVGVCCVLSCVVLYKLEHRQGMVLAPFWPSREGLPFFELDSNISDISVCCRLRS
jgi:hypothetical protein